MTTGITEVITRFNHALRQHDPTPIAELVADDCVDGKIAEAVAYVKAS
jgi:hypothetical protein